MTKNMTALALYLSMTSLVMLSTVKAQVMFDVAYKEAEPLVLQNDTSKDHLQLTLDIDMSFLKELEDAGVFAVLERVIEGLMEDLRHISSPFPMPDDANLYPQERIVK